MYAGLQPLAEHEHVRVNCSCVHSLLLAQYIEKNNENGTAPRSFLLIRTFAFTIQSWTALMPQKPLHLESSDEDFSDAQASLVPDEGLEPKHDDLPSALLVAIPSCILLTVLIVCRAGRDASNSKNIDKASETGSWTICPSRLRVCQCKLWKQALGKQARCKLCSDTCYQVHGNAYFLVGGTRCNDVKMVAVHCSRSSGRDAAARNARARSRSSLNRNSRRLRSQNGNRHSLTHAWLSRANPYGFDPHAQCNAAHHEMHTAQTKARMRRTAYRRARRRGTRRRRWQKTRSRHLPCDIALPVGPSRCCVTADAKRMATVATNEDYIFLLRLLARRK